MGKTLLSDKAIFVSTSEKELIRRIETKETQR